MHPKKYHVRSRRILDLPPRCSPGESLRCQSPPIGSPIASSWRFVKVPKGQGTDTVLLRTPPGRSQKRNRGGRVVSQGCPGGRWLPKAQQQLACSHPFLVSCPLLSLARPWTTRVLSLEPIYIYIYRYLSLSLPLSLSRHLHTNIQTDVYYIHKNVYIYIYICVYTYANRQRERERVRETERERERDRERERGGRERERECERERDRQRKNGHNMTC